MDKIVNINVNNKKERSVINLSSHVLTKIERVVLEKGLKFCQTPSEPDMNQILEDLRLFFRRMKLKAYFHNPIGTNVNNSQPTLEEVLSRISQNSKNDQCSVDDRTHNKFKDKSSFDPKINDPFLEAFFVLVKEEVDNHTIRIPKVNNLNKEERDALYSLQSNTDLTIKKQTKVLRL